MERIPMAVGLLICEQIIIDQKTHHVTPVNCWSQRTYANFPSEPESMVALAFLTEGLGEMPLELIVYSLDNWDEVERLTGVARFHDVLQEYRCTFHIRAMSFPTAGDYQASLLADGEIVAQRKLKIREKKA